MGRINPALLDTEWRHVLKAQRRIAGSIARVVADNPAPQPPVVPTEPVLLSVDLAPDGITILYTYSDVLPSNVLPIPVSTLMVPDPSNPNVMTFPTLGV